MSEISDQVFVLGCWERQVSIYLQQVRALNLIHSWFASGRLPERLTVLGGGFAGLTAAAAAARLGVRVRLLERQDRLLGYQVDNYTRWIHPHIHEWPRPGSRDPRAGLPVLDWEAGLAGPVAQGILAQLHGVEVELQAAPRSLEEYELPLILALGLGRERVQGSFTTYWADQQIGRAQESPQTLFVSGIGEGGLIDCLYAKLRNFSHMDVVQHCLDGTQELEAELLAAEGQPLTDRYARLTVPPHVDRCLAARLRTDTTVILNGSTADYLSPKADILNRFLISRLIRLQAIQYRVGRVEAIEPVGERWRVLLSEGEPVLCDRPLLRHGTEPALKTAFPALWEEYRARHPDGPSDEIPRPEWEPGWLRS